LISSICNYRYIFNFLVFIFQLAKDVQTYAGFSNYMRKEHRVSCFALYRTNHGNLTILKIKLKKKKLIRYHDSYCKNIIEK